jgi:hypothetical protein
MPGTKTRPRRWQARMRADAHPTEQLANAYDRLRTVAARQYRPRQDRAAQAAATARATRVMLSAASVLTEHALELERAEATESERR